MVPSNVVYADGVGTINGDGLNTFIQGVENVASLRNFMGVAGMVIFMQGTVTQNDNGATYYYWNPSSTAADNGGSVIQPNGASVGRWLAFTQTFVSLILSGTIQVAGLATFTDGINVNGPSTLTGNTIITGTAGISGALTAASGAFSGPITATAGTGFSHSQVFLSSSVFTVPTGVTTVYAIVSGGGGGGGGCSATTSGQISPAPGGNGGAWGSAIISGLTPGATIVVTVGGPGSGGGVGAAGSSGGTSSFGTYITAPGGQGGAGISVNSPPLAFAGSPPSGHPTYGSGIVSAGGSNETQGFPAVGASLANAFGGGGGPGLWGGGGGSGFLNLPGTPANSLGSGGGGACNGPSQASGLGGGVGANGVVIVFW